MDARAMPSIVDHAAPVGPGKAIEMQLGSILVPDLTAPRPCDVDVPFMHRRLGRLIRFSDHPRALSVAEHHGLVAYLAWLHAEPAAVHRWAVWHDAHEYALGDTVAPIKSVMGGVLDPLEAAWDAAIAGALGIPLPTDEERARVKIYDLLSLRIEWQWVLGLDRSALGAWADDLPPFGETRREADEALVTVLGPQRAESIRLARSRAAEGPA